MTQVGQAWGGSQPPAESGGGDQRVGQRMDVCGGRPQVSGEEVPVPELRE